MANVLAQLLEAFLARNSTHPAKPLPIRNRSERWNNQDQIDLLGGSGQTGALGAPVADKGRGTELQPILSSQEVNRLASRVAVIVPYYQGQLGILRRCLASIFAQRVNTTIRIHVIIVDDASPRPAEEELRDIQIPEQITVEIIPRQNGGPSAARNSGLDHVCERTGFIAFIDSDDTWREDHLQRAIDALGSSNDLYFSDHLQWGGFSYLDTKEFGALLRTGQSLAFRPLSEVKGVWACCNTDLIAFAVKEFIAHTSSIVYRTSKLFTCRFDEDLWCGEDETFFVRLLSCSTQTCVSTEIEVELGLGENIFFRSIWSSDSENHLKGFCHQFIAQNRIRRRYQLGSELHQILTRRIRSWRPALTFFILRQVLKRRAMPPNLCWSLLREDPLFFAMFPVNAMRAAVQWGLGKLQGKPVFTGVRISR